jgi:hypothetical protein
MMRDFFATTPLKCMRYVLYSKEYGVYLGACMGFGFWSKLDAAGQTHAVVFDNPTQVREVVLSWDEMPPDWVAMPVMCERPDYASSMECAQSGLPGWAA